MENLQTNIETNINAIVQQQFQKGNQSISIGKLLNYLNTNYDIEIDDNLLNEILTNNPNVQEVAGDKIVLGTKKTEDEESADDVVHDTAVKQAKKDAKFESVLDVATKIKSGDSFPATSIRLDESNDMYYFHKSFEKNGGHYIVKEFLPKQRLSESTFYCKAGDYRVYLELPLKLFLQKS